MDKDVEEDSEELKKEETEGEFWKEGNYLIT
jgi:hypothetical protein